MASTVPVFVVIADASKEHSDQRLGMFFRVLDAEAFTSKLAGWSNIRIIPEQLPAAEVHPAHAAVPSVAAALKVPSKSS